MTADWVTVATAAATGLAGLGGSWLNLRSGRRTEREKWQRQADDLRDVRRQQLYLDMMVHLARTELWIGEVFEGGGREYVDRPIDTVDLTPRVDLYAGCDLLNAWTAYIAAIGELAGSIRDRKPHPQDPEVHEVPAGKLLKVVEQLREHLRRGAGETR